MRILLFILLPFFSFCQNFTINAGSGTRVTINAGTGRHITINRAPVNPDAIPFYVFSGQSNMGRSQVSEMIGGEAASWAGAVPNTYMVSVEPFNEATISTRPYEQMNVGTNCYLYNRTDNDEFGPEASLMRNLSIDGAHRMAVKFGVGNSTLETQWRSGDNYRVWFYSLLDRAAFIADSLNKKLDLKAFVWMQGENDAINAAWRLEYYNNLSAFMSDFATKWQDICTTYGWTYNNTYKRVIGRLTSATTDTSQVYLNDIRKAQEDYAGSTPYGILINTDGYPLKGDGVHFTTTGQIEFGQDIDSALNAFSLTDTRAPRLIFPTVRITATDKVELIYNETLSGGSVPATGDFTVSGKTVSAVSVSGSSVFITVSAPFTGSESATVSYTGGTNKIQDAGGNIAANFTTQSIVNNAKMLTWNTLTRYGLWNQNKGIRRINTTGTNEAYAVQTLSAGQEVVVKVPNVSADAWRIGLSTNTSNLYTAWYYSMVLNGNYSEYEGTSITATGVAGVVGDYIKIKYSGTTLTIERSTDGTSWTVIATDSRSASGTYNIGFFGVGGPSEIYKQ